MTNISMITQDQKLIATMSPTIAAGDRKTVKLSVEFDSCWDGLNKSAVFFTSLNATVYEAILANNTCTIPMEVLSDKCQLFIGIRGVNNSGAVKTSTLIKYKIESGAPVGTASPVEPTPDVYQQLLAAYGSLDTKVNAVSQDVDAVNQNFTHYESSSQNVNSFDVNKTQSMISVDKIGGYSRKSKNVVNITYDGQKSGLTISTVKDSNGLVQYISVNGTSNNSDDIWFNTDFCGYTGNAYQYVMTNKPLPSGASIIDNSWSAVSSDGSRYSDISSFGEIYLHCNNSPTFNDFRIYPMYTKEKMTDIMYEPYGLISSKTSAVESVGKNLIPFTPLYISANQNIYLESDVASAFKRLNVGDTYIISAKDSNGNVIDASNCVFVVTDGASQLYNIGMGTTFTVQNNLDKVVDVYIYSTVARTIAELQIEKGTTATAYSKFVKSELYVPTTVSEQLISVSDTLYNYLEFKDNKVLLHKKVGSVDLGSLSWEYAPNGSPRFYSPNAVSLYNMKISSTNALSEYYTARATYDEFTANDKSILFGTDNYLYVSNSSYTDASTFKSAMNGQYLNYELKTEQTIDVTAQFLNNNLLPIEQGGTVTFVNECNLACPSTVSYLGATDSVKAVNESVNEVLSQNLGNIGVSECIGSFNSTGNDFILSKPYTDFRFILVISCYYGDSTVPNYGQWFAPTIFALSGYENIFYKTKEGTASFRIHSNDKICVNDLGGTSYMNVFGIK